MRRTNILIVCLLIALGAWADTSTTLYVGENYYCTAYDYMDMSKYIHDIEWHNDWEIYLDKVPGSLAAAITPREYFSGQAEVRCTWRELNVSTNTDDYKSHTWKISCRDNPIRVICSNPLSLPPGETGFIDCVLTNTSFEWWDNYFSEDFAYYSSDNSVAQVDESGVVWAKAPGTAQIEITSPKAQNAAHCTVIVEIINVESVTIPSTIEVEADQFKDLSVTVSPTNATVQTTEWKSSNPAIASIDAVTGQLTGVWPGTTTVYCTVNGSVKSNEAIVTVREPAFAFRGFSVGNGASGVETKPTIKATYSLALTRSSNFSQIALVDAQGNKVDGSVSVSDSTLSFTPAKHLQPLSTYTLTIPSKAVKNKWGTDYQSEQKVRFTTADWKRMSLSVTPTETLITKGERIVLTCSVPEATIYYSTDGGTPATRYTGPLAFAQDMTLRAVARLDGYYDSEELTKEYLQRMEIVERFPDAEPLYVYADANPSLTFNLLFRGDLGGISLQREDTQLGTVTNLDFESVLYDHTLYFVPKEPLEAGMSYIVKIPEAALVSEKGEQMAAIDWRFTTGSYATVVSVGGPELMAALKTGGAVWTWGRRLTTANAEDGSYSYTMQDVPSEFVSRDVVAVSSGYMHHALLKNDGTLWMWGRQLCGEFGNGSTDASATPTMIMDEVSQVSCGLQTTAIVKTDGSLWMCGRNDLCQIDSTRESHMEFVKLADDVSEARLSWGGLTIIKKDGNTETRIWDEAADTERAVEVDAGDMANVQYGWQNAVALGFDGSVWVWDGANTAPLQLITGRAPQPAEGVSLLADTLRLTAVGDRAVADIRPVPLLADYETLHFISSDATIAEVSSRGVVTALADGEAVVTVTMTDASGKQFEAHCAVLIGTALAIRDTYAGEAWQMKVKCVNRTLHITNVPKGMRVSLYYVAGGIVYQGQMTDNELLIPVSTPGVYVVRANRQSGKVIVR